MKQLIFFSLVLLNVNAQLVDRVVYKGTTGLPGNGKKVVLIAGDEEYRSEETIPLVGRLLSVNHGFDCVVLWSQNENGFIDPDALTNIPGLEELEDADALFIFMRFRAPDDDKMKFFDDYVNSGKPILGVRTATHSFNFDDAGRSDSIYRDFYQFDNDGGFGGHVLGETYSGQVGDNGGQGTHGVIADGQENNPIVNGIDNDPSSKNSIHGNSNLYLVSKIFESSESTAVITGQLLNSLDALSGDDKTEGTEPIAWTRNFVGPTPTSQSQESNTSPIFTSTIGVSNDDESVGVRRLLVNAVYDRLGMEVPNKANVTLMFDFNPTDSGVGGSVVQGKFKPEDFADPFSPIPPSTKDNEAAFEALIERDPWILVLMLFATIGLGVLIGLACRKFRKSRGIDEEYDEEEDDINVKYAEMVAL